MGFIVWVADHALWITLVGAICSAAIRFEKVLPKRVHKALFAISLFISFATPLLGLLKKSVDDRWKAETQRKLEAVKPKPFKERLIAC